VIAAACISLHVAEPLSVGSPDELQTHRVEHALLLVDVAVCHVHDAHVVWPVKVPEGHVCQDCLHVSVVEFKSLCH